MPVQSLLLRLEALHISSKVRVNEKSLKNKRAEDCLSNYRKFINLWNNLIACREPDEKAALSILWKTASLMEKLQLYCDLNHRFKSFWLAVHYWEGRWVLDRDDRAFEKLNKGKHSREKVFGLISYLTPFFVSTFHSAPKFVSYAYNDPLGSGWIRQPLYKFFDLLIVDEAGQVSPEVAVPSFALAKKAIVMGDVYQIEPISKIPSQKIDLSNMRKSLSVISETEFQKISDLGYACSSGSLMRMAQNLSKYKLPAENQFQGTLLQEHRRCVDEIIYFCNHFVYQNLLIPKVGSLDYVRGDPDLNLPALGYCHVPSYSEQNMGSRSNSVEAAAIAAWISRWKNDLLTVYGKGNPKGLKQILAIVTPFQAQKDVILKALKERNILDNITVGTVHGLQGSERPLILFSPVYGRQDKEANCFFDKGWNMLNVAVSRAKEHFLVFGNMDFFQPDRIDRPSGALASLLFASPKNALDDTFLFDDPIIPATFTGVVERISNLQTHRTCLIDSIVSAKKQILIVSPFISISALEADHLEKYLGDAVKRGVEVKVFTDAFLDMENRQLKPQSKKGREYLKKIGVEVKLKRGIHNKTLAVDDKILVEGSFNWLSASRDLSSPFQRQEASLIVKGEGTANDIIKVYQEMEKLEDY
ncbi:MAG: hypothetical protein IPJ69_03930 [Deltaproteobacteria bacterium]|nr:MAG: hypothetical protein IPJ69_03930 [Deltaproteobacteria bacterium]